MSTDTPQPKGEPKPTGFVDDIVAAILNPGYIGGASLMIINVALVVVIVLIALRVFSDPRGLQELENSVHLIALIPAIGLLFSINWYAYMVSSIKASEKHDAQAQGGKSDKSSSKKNKKKLE